MDEETELWGDDPTQMSIGAWVEAAPFRAHVQQLMAIGDLSVEELAQLARVSQRAAYRLIHGWYGRRARRVCPVVARRLIRLRPDDVVRLDRRLVPANPTLTRLIDLLSVDGRVDRWAARTGVDAAELWAVLGGAALCTVFTAVRVGVTHEDLLARQFEERFEVLPDRPDLNPEELEPADLDERAA